MNALAFTPDGKTLVTGCDDGKARSFDTTTGRHLRVFQSAAPRRFHSLSLSRDGRFLALALHGPNEVRVFDVVGGKRQLTLSRSRRQHEVASTAFSPDGRLLATGGGDPRLHLFEVASGQEVQQLVSDRSWSPVLVAFSPTGRVLASALLAGGMSKEGEVVRLADVRTGQALEPLSCLGSETNALYFSADGATLAMGLKDGRILVWDFALRTRSLLRPPAALDEAKVLTLWNDLADRQAPTAHRAVQALVAGGDQTVSFLKAHLKPAVAVEPKRIRESVARLDSRKPAVRKKALEELEEVLDQALPLLREERARTTSAEVRKRLDELLGRPGIIKSATALRNVRAVAVLERIGSAEARKLLSELAKGSVAAPETCQAQRAWLRLSKKADDSLP